MMRHVDEFRDPRAVTALAAAINRIPAPRARLMEVCGTHTMAIARYGLRELVAARAELVAGPGCPVCVTAQGDLDWFLEAARLPGVVAATFGDMMRVPGSRSTLERERAQGADVRVVYSPADAVELARRNPERQVIFFGVGFETTAPAVAMSVLEARAKELTNYRVYCAHKLIPPALRALVEAPDAAAAPGAGAAVNGFICPGHVSVIIGSRPYEFVAREHGVPCVIAGFEPVDVLAAVRMLLVQIAEGRAAVEIEYGRVVAPAGNPRARAVVEEVFAVADARWRGLGEVPRSGLAFSAAYAEFDARQRFQVTPAPAVEPAGCRCGEVLRGVILPAECALFGGQCTPRSPVGACMVSSEGACAAHYRYRRSGSPT
ncbi:MAG TPA: hydrogenase formation protein HypD [Armatimonadota bacterium]|nr:hydrogenase formation protein HypD [Armatimonadota bacterium]